MERIKRQTKNNRKHKNSRNFVLAIIALVLFSALLFASIFIAYEITGDDTDEHGKSLNFLQSSILWSNFKETAASELERIENDRNELLQNQPPDDSADNPDDSVSDLSDDEDDEPEPDEPEDEYFGVAYLTFDDGPSRAVTAGILDLLAEEEIKATFFVIYRTDVEDLYQRIIDEGHEIANHSYSHNYNRLYSRGVDAFKEDILRAHDFVLDNFGFEMSVFRFPGGSASWRRDGIAARREVLAELGYVDFDWHIDSNDAAPSGVDTSAATLTRNVLGHKDVGSREHLIILMHDYKWRQTTLEALPAIISGLREQGYRFDIMSNYPLENTEES